MRSMAFASPNKGPIVKGARQQKIGCHALWRVGHVAFHLRYFVFQCVTLPCKQSAIAAFVISGCSVLTGASGIIAQPTPLVPSSRTISPSYGLRGPNRDY